MARNDIFIELHEVTFIEASANAVLVSYEGSTHWIPQSQLHEDTISEIRDLADEALFNRFLITEWIAEEKGLI